jgi:hypothetical protein
VVRNAKTMLGRVTSLDRLTSLAALALGPPLGAFLFAQFRIRDAILSLLLVTVTLLAAAATLNRALRTTGKAWGRPARRGREEDADIESLVGSGCGPREPGNLTANPGQDCAATPAQPERGSERTTMDREPTLTRSPAARSAVADPAAGAGSLVPRS